jgi:lipopolysaccharide transport protein LptA
MKKITVILTVAFLGTLITIPVNAAEKVEKKEKAPITINADKMQYLQKENCMVAEKNVIVALDDQSLMADKVIAFQGINSEGKQDFTRIVATGDVVIKTPERSLYGKKAVWNRNENVIRFTGNPVVKTKGGQEISAEVIKYNVLTGKVTFEGVAKAKMKMSDKNNIDFSGF